MPTVELRFSALPGHVRTARLVVAAMARRVGIDESTLDEVRLAVGEACSRAVALHRRHCPDAAVTVRFDDDDGRLRVAVTDQAPASAEHPAEHSAEVSPGLINSGSAGGAGDGAGSSDDPGDDYRDPIEALPASMGIAVITGLVDDVKVDTGPDGSTILMSWTVAASNGVSRAGAEPG